MSGAAPPPDVLTIAVNGVAYRGWIESRVTRGIERFPSDFDVEITVSFPGQNNDVIAVPGNSVVVSLGRDVVLTGWIDRVQMSISPDAHSFRLTGRGKCCDLADCAALVNSMVVSGTSTQQLADQLLPPFGLTARTVSGADLGVPFAFPVDLGTTPYELLELVARFEGVLLYEDETGNMVFSTVGASTHASGIAEGVNVQAAGFVLSMDQRFSEYHVALMSTDQWTRVGFAGNELVVVKDAGTPRYRPRVIISEQGQYSAPLALRRANWELARRRGRGQVVQVTVDSWRDGSGLLWQPNYLVPVNLPSLKLVQQVLCIGEVSYLRGRDGTSAQLMLMPPEAFTPQPPPLPQLQLAIKQAQGTADLGRPAGSADNTRPTGPS